ncbi:spore germination protein GerPC [Pseudalkalibacillus caeni]|uniref:Spore gernimation protein n=1 Tax=Exobacillus caeni TaxID=2574798 RepID=A0A5R9F4G5_9BACL|nr:spore germination protein GerPC [Pseudalkalibacillus caeni]TLS37921.1 spore gernimation protein [Pseudalkalibacillus caeni]
MYQYGNYFYSLQQLQQAIHQQNQRIQQLENVIGRLQQELTNIKEEPRTNIERVEYKFDQLKIEQLDGTLNIGLTPNGKAEAIEEFSVNGNSINGEGANAPYPETIHAVQRGVQDYLQNAVWKDMQEIEQRLNYPLDPPYRQFIIEDIKKQVDQRINYYLNEMGNRVQTDDPSDLENSVIKKVNKDIYNTIETFIKNLPKGTDNNELPGN